MLICFLLKNLSMSDTGNKNDIIDIEQLSIYEKDIEEILVDTNSEEDYEDELLQDQETKVFHKGKESEKRGSISEMYNEIQKVLGGGDAEEPRLRILKKACAACKKLWQEELNLKLETEMLLQMNWKLKRKLEKLQKKKKRKSGSATISRRLSGPPVPTTIKTNPIEKRSVSIDDLKLVDLTNNSIITPSSNVVMEETTIIPSPIPTPKNPKRKVKKRSGLTEEEKEFCKLEEKIEDLLYEVEALWNDVLLDEDKEKDLDDTKTISDLKQTEGIPMPSSGPSQDTQYKEKIKLTDINKLIEPQLNPIKNKEVLKVANITKSSTIEPQHLENKKLIKIANISKLLDPKLNPIILTTNSSNFINTVKEHRRSSTSDDECPRLVIDENPQGPSNEEHLKLNQRELDVMEALQAVDTLCLSLVSDEPTSSESDPLVARKKTDSPTEKPDVISISDSEDDTANSDIVILD